MKESQLLCKRHIDIKIEEDSEVEIFLCNYFFR